jgi:eukaryotic-like serine/threonine-protein kinase
MPLTNGTKLGPYEIISPIGAGGMGEVYRATDKKLNRDVAIKVIPQEFVRDEQRLARFEREAQVLASLNHTNVASIYGLEESGGAIALVMELVEGPTLEERIKEGAIPIEEALPIAKQIAEALEYAHERGIVHRDLKPANIKLTHDGKVKVLDFGLAKALQDDSAATQNISNSPTLTAGATKAGFILGTPAYMSPEQAKGKTVDRRSDIWSFGVVFFQMLSGKQAFSGETVSDVLAKVIEREPDWSLLPAPVPASINRLLHRCIEKDLKRRLQAIGEARIAIEEAISGGSRANETNSEASESRSAQPTWRRILPWAVAAAAMTIAAGVLLHRGSVSTASRDITHLDISYPPNVEPVSGLLGGFALSSDGRTVAFIGVRDGVRRLYVRRLDRPEAIEVNDTGGVNTASFSPAGTSVVFVPGSTLMTRVSLASGERATLTSADIQSETAWSAADIIFAREGALWSIPVQGGSPHQLTVLDAARHEVVHGNPIVLPGGRTVLFSCLSTESGTERIEAVSMDGSHRSVVIEHAISPVWSPTGHLLFGRDGALWAVPFDPERVAVLGTALPVIPSGTISTARAGGLGFWLSSNGTLMSVPTDFGYEYAVSVGRDGSEVALNLPPGRYGSPRISPDGHRLLIESESTIIEALDLLRGTRAKLGATALGTNFSTWTSDGAGVVFRRFNVPFWVAADGSGKSGPVPAGVIGDFPSSPGPDPDSIIDVRVQAKTSGDIFLMSISGKFQPKPLLVTPAFEGGAELSPDGHWMVYQSNESGQPEIYVRRFPAMDREWPVSEGGGVQPRWGGTGREIFYRNGQHMMSVAFDPTKAEPTFGKPAALFADVYDFGQGASIPNYDVTREGRFIMLRRGSHGNSLRVVLNWTEELKQILAAGGVH